MLKTIQPLTFEQKQRLLLFVWALSGVEALVGVFTTAYWTMLILAVVNFSCALKLLSRRDSYLGDTVSAFLVLSSLFGLIIYSLASDIFAPGYSAFAKGYVLLQIVVFLEMAIATLVSYCNIVLTRKQRIAAIIVFYAAYAVFAFWLDSTGFSRRNPPYFL